MHTLINKPKYTGPAILLAAFFLTQALFLTKDGYSQSISVSPANTNAEAQDYVQNVLLGPCVTASNVTYVGAVESAGTFDGNGTVLGLNGGIVLTSGLASIAEGPDNSDTEGNGTGGAGDPDLSTLASNFQTYDASILEFDFVPQSDTLRFNYIFGSEEYPEYVGSGYNDVFGFFISGPGFTGPYTGGAENIAIIPGTTSPVAINNLNNGYSATEPATGPCNNCAFYVDNSSGPAVQYDAHTVVLTAEAVVTPCETYHIKIAIADAGDGALDSGVFLEEGSFSAVGEEPVELAVLPGVTGVFEGCNTNSFVFRRLPGASNTQPLTVNYSVSGTATPGVDYTALPGMATIPAGEDSVVISLDVALDFTAEGNETVVLSLPTGGCSCTAPTPVSLDVFDNDTQLSLSTSGTTTICLGQSADLTANPAGSITPYTSGWDNGAPAGDNVTVSPTNTTTYTYTVTDACAGQSLTSTETITVVRPDFTVDDDQQCLDGNLFTFTNTGASGGTVTHFWDFGDGNSSTDENPTHTYASDGTYTVTHDVIYVADGCTATASATIIVFDEPVVTATTDQNVDCAGDDDGAISTTVSGGTALFNYSWLPNGATTANLSGLAPGNYTVTVIDDNGCTDSDQVTVVQSDTEFPIALCQDGDAFVDTAGIATISATLVDNGSSDNCGLASLVVSPNAFDCNQLGANPVTLTATDVNGHVSTCNAVVTVLDTVLPTVTCQDVTLVLDGSGSATLAVADVQVTAYDNCALQNVTLSPTSFNCSDVGTTTATLTATDASGNTGDCQANITVEEIEDPQAICQDITVQLDASGNVSVTGNQLGSGSTDNCGIADLSATPTDFTCADIGGNSVTVEVTDNAGNTATCTATVTVEDNLAPNALCQDATLYLDAAGFATLSASDIDNGSDDNCAVASISVSPTDFDCSNIGSNSVTLTVEDVNGNSANCNANVEVQDTISPQAICQDITVSLDINGNATITESQIDNGSIDNCSAVSLNLSQTSFDCSTPSPGTVELTVSDVAGNSSSCQAQVFLLEGTPPTALCQNVTVQLDASGNATALASDVDNGSTDNCGAVALDLLPSTFTCAELGENPVELIVEDGSGNTSVCSALVTVEDNVPPTAICQNVSVELDALGFASIQSADIENGSTDNCTLGTFSVSPSAFDCADIGVQQVTLSVSDAFGNTNTCTADVTVSDGTAPNTICQDITVQLDANGTVSIATTDVDGGSTDACGIDNYSVDNDQFDCSQLGPNAVELTVSDQAGNQSTCNASVTVEDSEPPTALCQNITVYLDETGNGLVVAADADVGSSDNCAVSSVSLSATDFDCSNAGQELLTLTVEDGSGNTDDCVTVATILDTIAPVIANCPSDILISPSSSQCNSAVNWTEPTATDNCSQTLTSSHLPGETFPVGTTTVSYNSEDPSGNTTACSFEVTVTPTELITTITSPTFDCGQNISCNGSEDGEATVSVSGGCEPYTYQWSDGQTVETATGLNAGEHVVLVVDNLGNSTTDTVILTEPEPLLTDTLAASEFIGGGNVSCFDAEDGSISLNVTGGADCSQYTFNWSGPNGFTSNSEDLAGIAAGTYSVEVTDAHGCSIINSIELFEPDLLELAGFPNSYNGVNITCAGESDGAINLEVDGGTEEYTFSWSNGETTEDIDSLSAGNYSVLVTDTNGCQQTAAFDLIAPDALDLQLLNAEPVACNGESTGEAQVEVTGGTPSYTYQWSNGDSDAILNNAEAGTYQLSVSDVNGCSDSLGVQITEPDAIQLSVLEVIDATCFGSEDGSITIAAQGGSGIYEFLWQPTLQTTQSATDLGAGEYLFTATDSNGCSAQDTAVVAEPDQMIITTSGDTTVCPGEPVELSASVDGGGGAYLISWENGQGFGETYESFFTQTTNVGITATDQNGCEAIPNSIIVSTFNPVGADFEFTFPEPCIAPFEVQFDNQTANANAYSWSFGNGENSTQFLPTTFYDTSGTFVATLIAESADGCIDTVTESVSIAPLPVAAFNLPNSEGCFPIMVGHFNQSTGASSYLWDFGDGEQSDDGSPYHFYEDPGAYTVTLIATSSTGCSDTLSVDSAVFAFPRPTASFTAMQTLSETEREFTFDNTSVDGTDYFWTFGNGDFSEEFEPTYEYPEHGNYNVILSVQNEYGCEDTARFTLYADLVAELFVPNAMSPEEFGEAGSFLPKGTGIAQYHLWIFDQWGNQLWETRKLVDGSPAEGWDGRYNGELVPQGAYVWRIEAVFKDGMAWEGIEAGDGQLKSTAGTVTVLY